MVELDHNFVRAFRTYSPLAEQPIGQMVMNLLDSLFPGYFSVGTVSGPQFERRTYRLLEILHRQLTEQIAASTESSAERCEPMASAALAEIPRIRASLMTDIRAAYEGDPAATSIDEIILCYPFVIAVTVYRFARVLATSGVKLLPAVLSRYAHIRTGCSIHPSAEIGDHFFIDHGTGVVIGRDVRLGDRVKIYQRVSLGEGAQVGSGTVIYAGAAVRGGVSIGCDCVVGANVVLMQSLVSQTGVYFDGKSTDVRPRRRGQT